MKLFFEPNSIAVIGASARKVIGDGYLNILQPMSECNFSGSIYPINPSTDNMFNMQSYGNLKELPEKIDLAIIALPRTLVPSAVRECVDFGIKAIMVFSAGFGEADEEGKELQNHIVSLAREGGARILGPNTLGFINAHHNFHTAFNTLALDDTSPISFVTQSGLWSYRHFPDSPRSGPGRIGKAICLGNTSDVNFVDALHYLEADPQTKVIALHIEGIRNGREFIEVASRITKKKPIIALKAGRSEEAARSAASHSGSLAGKDEIYNALFKQCGIIRVANMAEMEDVARAFLMLPPMKGKRVGILSHVGGACTVSVDACVQKGLDIAKLSPMTISGISKIFPEWMPVTNPLDIWFAMASGRYREGFELCLDSILRDDGVDGVLCTSWAVPESDFEVYNPSDIITQCAAKFPEKPIVAWVYGPSTDERKSAIERTGEVAVYPTPERAINVLSALHTYWQVQKQ